MLVAGGAVTCSEVPGHSGGMPPEESPPACSPTAARIGPLPEPVQAEGWGGAPAGPHAADAGSSLTPREELPRADSWSPPPAPRSSAGAKSPHQVLTWGREPSPVVTAVGPAVDDARSPADAERRVDGGLSDRSIRACPTKFVRKFVSCAALPQRARSSRRQRLEARSCG